MLSPSWLIPLRQVIQSRRKPDHLPRVAVLGIGHELNGDDAAGLMVARALSVRLGHQDRLCVIDAGAAPENQTGTVRAFRPDVVLLVDAAQMDDIPGTVRWIAWQDTTGIGASSHTLPPYMLAKFLVGELGCEVALLGLQPAQNLFDTPLSTPVAAAVEQVVGLLAEELSNSDKGGSGFVHHPD